MNEWLGRGTRQRRKIRKGSLNGKNSRWSPRRTRRRSCDLWDHKDPIDDGCRLAEGLALDTIWDGYRTLLDNWRLTARNWKRIIKSGAVVVSQQADRQKTRGNAHATEIFVFWSLMVRGWDCWRFYHRNTFFFVKFGSCIIEIRMKRDFKEKALKRPGRDFVWLQNLCSLATVHFWNLPIRKEFNSCTTLVQLNKEVFYLKVKNYRLIHVSIDLTQI